MKNGFRNAAALYAAFMTLTAVASDTLSFNCKGELPDDAWISEVGKLNLQERWVEFQGTWEARQLVLTIEKTETRDVLEWTVNPSIHHPRSLCLDLSTYRESQKNWETYTSICFLDIQDLSAVPPGTELRVNWTTSYNVPDYDRGAYQVDFMKCVIR